MGDYLKERERERKLEKIRGKAKAARRKDAKRAAVRAPRKKAPPKYLRPIRLKHGEGAIWPLEEDPAEWDHEAKRFPKRIRREYVAMLALVGRNGKSYGYLEATPRGDWFWWKPGARSAGATATTLREALERQMPRAVMAENAALAGPIDELETLYRAEVPGR